MKAMHKTTPYCSSFTLGRTKLSVFDSNLSNRRCISCSASRLEEQYAGLFDGNEHEDLRFVMEPFTYFLKVPRQTLRPKFIQSFNYWMNLPDDKVKSFFEIYELTYTYACVYDDILDEQELRRGIPTAQRIYGLARTSTACSSLVFLLLKKIKALDNNNETLFGIYMEEMLKQYIGQSRDMYWQLNLKCPTLDEYFAMVEQKSQSLYNVPLRMMQALSEYKTDLAPLRRLLVIFIQLQNDYNSIGRRNIHDKKYWDLKGFADDITEGKFSPAIIHAANSGTEDGEVILNIIRQKTKDHDMKKHCLLLLEKLGSIEFLKQSVENAERQLREEIERLGGNPMLHETIDLWNKWNHDEIVTDSY